jgi:hypothetical protein
VLRELNSLDGTSHFSTGAVVPFHGEVPRFYNDFGLFEIPPGDPNTTVESDGYVLTTPPIQKYRRAEQKCQSPPLRQLTYSTKSRGGNISGCIHVDSSSSPRRCWRST